MENRIRELVEEMDLRDLKSAGKELVEYAQFCAEGDSWSRSDILFPYIYKASKRMSSRAISRWLKESRGIKFSAASVAKVLREQERHFKKIAWKIQPMLERLGHYYEMHPHDIVALGFRPKEIGSPSIAEVSGDPMSELSEVFGLEAELEQEWFGLGSEIRTKAQQYFEFEPVESDEDDEDSEA